MILLRKVELFELADHVSKEKRSENMSRIHGKNTKPELLVRHSLHKRGLRYLLHNENLPGKPDMTFPKYHTVLFVHGCFWHQHPNCKKASKPKSNSDYWREKFLRNKKRDEEVVNILESEGWKVIIIWECEIPNSFADSYWEFLAGKIRNHRGQSLSRES